MKILALDSSGMTASVALMEDGQLVADYTVNYKKTHSQTLLPMLDTIVQMIGLELESVDAIAIAAGPGSFTGLRIGSATAKGLGLALDKPVIEVPTIYGLANNLFDTEGLIVPMMDARRAQVYTGICRFRDHRLEVVKEQCAVSVEELVRELNALGEKVTVLGDGVEPNRSYLSEKLTVPWAEAPGHLNRQRAAAVAELGSVYYSEGKYVSAAEHSPEYLRVSQAEREQAEKGRSMREMEEKSARLRPADYGAGDSYED
jgi:tRNA threonylcarbamoyl adenosine modification protein YeaZ